MSRKVEARLGWILFVLLQILPRGGFAQIDNVGGVAGDTLVRTPNNGRAIVRGLKNGDVILGLKGYKQKVSDCNVISVVEQGDTELAGNFSFTHMMYDGDVMTTQAKLEPSIHGLVDKHSYAVLTDCELMQAETPTGVEYFSFLSTAFCGSSRSRMSWRDYHTLFGTLIDIMAKTGDFWMDIRNYNDCAAGPTCTVPSWRDALPPICTTMLECAKSSKQATCDTLNNLSHAFVKEHLAIDLQAKFTSAYPNLGQAVMEKDTRGGKKWWECLQFWKWKCWKFNWINVRNPWTIFFLVCLCVAINAGIAFSVMWCMDEGDEFSYYTVTDEGDYEDRTQTATYDDDGY